MCPRSAAQKAHVPAEARVALVLLRPAIESLAAGHTVWAVAEAAGLRPLGLVSVDDAWMTLRLKRPVA